jgi:hypothetical protein
MPILSFIQLVEKTDTRGCLAIKDSSSKSLQHHAMTVDCEGNLVLVICNFRETRIDVRSLNGGVQQRFRLMGAGLLRFPSGVAVDGASHFFHEPSTVVVSAPPPGFIQQAPQIQTSPISAVVTPRGEYQMLLRGSGYGWWPRHISALAVPRLWDDRTLQYP